MGRIIAAVLAGYALSVALVALTDQILSRLIPGFDAMTMPPVDYFVISIVSNTLYAVAGGFLCAVIARENTRKALLYLMIFGEVLGVFSQIMFWNTIPHWFGLALLVIYPIGVWIGGNLAARRNRFHPVS
jgi:hypothetical protein